MEKITQYYTLDRANGLWTIWLVTEIEKTNGGSGGTKKIYSSGNKKDCLYYCKIHEIKLRKK